MSKHSYSRMHSKLMLLFHTDHLRIVVPSANQTRHDWGEDGRLENSLFLIDLPRLETGRSQAQTQFLSSLLIFLRAQQFPENVINGVEKFDFSRTMDIMFVHSIPVSYEGDSTTGLVLLSQAIRDLSGSESGEIEVDYASSSVGHLNETQMKAFTAALKGKDPFSALEPSLYDLDQAGTTGKSREQSEDEFRIVFPRQTRVEDSSGGADVSSSKTQRSTNTVIVHQCNTNIDIGSRYNLYASLYCD
jgi:hypothetical protein